MSAWTPGPWSIHSHMGGDSITDCTESGFIAHTVYFGAGDVLLGQLEAYQFADGQFGGSPRVSVFDENRANARLCIAAPLLYAALVNMIDAYNNLTDFGEECHAVVAARAALAAATGETK